MIKEPFNSESTSSSSENTLSSYEPFSSLTPQPVTQRLLKQPVIQSGSSTNNSQSDFTRFSRIDNQINIMNARLELFDKNFTKLYELDSKMTALEHNVSSLETDKKDIKEYMKTSNSVDKKVLIAIALIPTGFLFTLYFALKDYMETAPNWVDGLVPFALGISALFNIFVMAIYIPKELEYIKKDIDRLDKNN